MFLFASCHVQAKLVFHVAGANMRSMTRTFMIILGWLLLVPGLVFVVLPPPFAFGIFLVLPGIAILVAHSRAMRRLVQTVRARYPLVNTSLGAVETRVPDVVGRSLKRTNPSVFARALRWKRRKKETGSATIAAPNTETEKSSHG